MNGFGVAAREQLLALFDESVRTCLLDLEAAVAAGDRGEVRRVAHLLKGSGATLGAAALSRACRGLELRASEDAVGASLVLADLDEVAEAARRSQVELREHLLETADELGEAA